MTHFFQPTGTGKGVGVVTTFFKLYLIINMLLP